MIDNVSDTARWVAVHRAVETERDDALFRDHWADVLAGERGRDISAVANREIRDDWFLVTRTKLIDDRIIAAVDAGCDLVLNLGAGLDARPYRLDLPSRLSWVEVDLPGLIDEKNALLANERPRCRLRRDAVDLTDRDALATLLDRELADAERALVVSEGFVMYLDESDVVELASSLRRPQIVGWCLDFSAAGVAAVIAARNEGLLQRAPWTFLPADGVAFFEKHCWTAEYIESIIDGTARFGRLSPELSAAFAGPAPDPRNPGAVPYSAVVELTPNG